MAILEDRQSGYIHILYHTSKLHTSVGVVSLAIHTTEILAGQIPCATTTTTEVWSLEV